jgi:prolyl 4-hydroxylase
MALAAGDDASTTCGSDTVEGPDGTCIDPFGADTGDDEDLFEYENDLTQSTSQFVAHIINKSSYRIDIHWDDGKYGSVIGTLEAGNGKQGTEMSVNTQAGHSFFFTRHGVRQALFDPRTNTKHRFVVKTESDVFVVPEDAAPSNNPCQDRFDYCQQLAQGGGCSSSPGWMIVHCCEACDKELDASRLIDPKIRCDKDFLNITSPAWEPGDLNKLFSTWATSSEFDRYTPVVHSSPDPQTYGGAEGPWVITFDTFLSHAEADGLIRGGEMAGFDRSTDQGAMNELGEQEKVVSLTRTSSNAWCTGACEQLPEVRSVTRRIEEVTGVPETNYESFQILEYGPNQFYRRHHDSSMRDISPSGPRIMTFFLYLSDVEEGGATHFDQLGISVTPKKGRALVWPSVIDKDPTFWDSRMYHEAQDVIRGKKYAANHWIHLNDFMGPNKWGCTGSFS